MAIPNNLIQVVNQVMSELGRLGVSASTDDEYAVLIAQRLPTDLTYLLQQAQWNFATKYYTSSSPNVSSPSPQWLYAFSLPGDFLNFYAQYVDLQYQVIGNVLCSNAATIRYFYIYQITDFTILPQWFVQALVFYTASRVAKPLTENTDIAKEMYQLYVRELTNAKWQNISLNPILTAPYNQYDQGGTQDIIQ